MVFPDKAYVSLENPASRALADTDPQGFLASYPDGAIIDEVQRVPDLLSYIQGIVDERQRPGQFILTGSSQFEMMESVTQSLAGRTALLKLLPFSYDEVYAGKSPALDDMLFRGFYPRIHDQDLAPSEAYAFYVETYLERDVRTLLSIKERTGFEAFLRLCAGRTGQLLNMTSLSVDVGVGVHTIKAWLSVLEASFIVAFLRPHHANFRKRLVKSPKLYFLDTGLACYLLGITQAAQLTTHPLRGAIFESYVVAEMLKGAYNRVRRPNLSFFRDNSGNEVDALIDGPESVRPVEIKASATVRPELFKSLEFYGALNPAAARGALLYAGDERLRYPQADVIGFRSVGALDVGW
jgi:predicted AAA+ superfamily ATPase